MGFKNYCLNLFKIFLNLFHIQFLEFLFKSSIGYYDFDKNLRDIYIYSNILFKNIKKILQGPWKENIQEAAALLPVEATIASLQNFGFGAKLVP